MRRNENQEQALAKLRAGNLSQLVSIGNLLKEGFSNAPDEPLTEEMQRLLTLLERKNIQPQR